MAVKLYRCGSRARFGPCRRVQKALDDADRLLRMDPEDARLDSGWPTEYAYTVTNG